MKNNKKHTVGTFLKLNIKTIESDKSDNLEPQIHDCSISWLGTDTSIKMTGLNKFYDPIHPLLVKRCGRVSAFHM